MYYQNYEDYMRSVLGYPIESQNTYETFNYSEPYEMEQGYTTPRYSSEINDLYPEIYKIVNPMVCKICDVNTKPITRELIDQMTDEIYLNLESQPELNADTNNRTTTEKSSKTTTGSSSSSNLKRNGEVSEIRTSESREDRQRRPNNTLRDLIRILILNRLLGGGFPGRPPRPRPPRPVRPPMRPPFPRDYNYDEYYKY